MSNPMDRLTSDAVAARQAGMSYGKWKAAQERTEPLTPPPDVSGIDPEKLRYCKYCRAPFEKGKYHRRFCSRECSEKYDKTRKRENRYRSKED